MESPISNNALRNCALLRLVLPSHQAPATQTAWIATWAASAQPVDAGPREPLLRLDNQTVRVWVRISIGGNKIRIRLSNEYGSTPLLVGSMTVAVPVDPASVQSESIQAVIFNGHRAVTMLASGSILSDPVAFRAGSGTEIAISPYFPNPVASPTLHALVLKRIVVPAHGDHAGSEEIEGTESHG
jgi:hypothetical protein